MLYKISKGEFFIADSGRGKIVFTTGAFAAQWLGRPSLGNQFGIVLALSTTPDFFSTTDDRKSSINLLFLLRYLSKYLRSNNRLKLNFTKKLENKQAEIIPIVLLTLVENIFKHGNLLDHNHPARIELYTNCDQLIFRIRNLIANTLPTIGERTGINNITSRLAQTYPNAHLFTTEVEEKTFQTELIIDLK